MKGKKFTGPTSLSLSPARSIFFGSHLEVETLAVLIFLINGFALCNRKHELDVAYKREAEDMIELARSEAARAERLKSRGLI
jgi:hypothetical protein